MVGCSFARPSQAQVVRGSISTAFLRNTGVSHVFSAVYPEVAQACDEIMAVFRAYSSASYCRLVLMPGIIGGGLCRSDTDQQLTENFLVWRKGTH